MVKRFQILVVAAVMMLGIFGLTACKYKEMAMHPNSDERIDTMLEYALRQSFAKLVKEEINRNIAIKDIWVRVYYGTYGDSAVVVMDYKNNIPPPLELQEIVAGFEFFYNTKLEIRVWNDGKFLSLTEAYRDELLTIENIESIWQQTQQ